MTSWSVLALFNSYQITHRNTSIVVWMYNVHIRVRWVIIAIKLIFSRLPVAWILRSWSNNNRELNLIDQLMTQEVLGNRTSWPFSFSQAPGFHIGLHSIRDAGICLQNWFKGLPKIEKKENGDYLNLCWVFKIFGLFKKYFVPTSLLIY